MAVCFRRVPGPFPRLLGWRGLHEPAPRPADGAILARITAICEDCPAHGYRRVGAELRHRGLVVNAKKVRRIMTENGLNPKRRRRYVVTTDSNHDGPIFPNIAKGFEVHGPDQLWVADITYVAIATGFVYLAVILDAWSRRVVGYALDRKIDARLATARVDAVLTQVEAAKTKAQEAADAARKAGAAFALMAALSLVIGAIIASASAALGGRLRDD